MASNLTAQVRNIADVTIAVANGDLSKKITVDGARRDPAVEGSHQHDGDQLRSFASEVTRVAKEVGTEGKLGGQAIVPGVAGTWKDLTDSVNAHVRQPDGAGAKHRAGDDGRCARGSFAQDHRRCVGRDPRIEGDHQYDGRSAQLIRLRGDPRGPRSRQ